MELDKLKFDWDKMTKEMEEQKVLTDRMILEITNQKYKDKLGGISLSEGIGTLVCLVMAVIIFFQLDSLDTWYLMLCGIFCIFFCVLLPALSLMSIHKMRKIDVTCMAYKEVIEHYAKGRTFFVKVQKAGFYLGFLFAMAILPALMKIFKDKDLFEQFQNYFWYIPLLFVFHIFFSRFVFKKYRSITNSAKQLLEELRD
jgi:glucan phosphoethanolaminetransferase (alkaline phosphatase superfamily)